MKLRDYQEVGVAYLRGRKRAALFLDMGLGKTATALSALGPEHLPALVVAPKRVAENVWAAEARLWRPDLRVAVAAGEPELRRSQLAVGADVVVISRDNLRDVYAVWPSKRKPPPFKTFIIDELSGYKNRASVRWKTAARIVKTCTYVWGLTGTPSPNGIMDLWAQIALLDGGERLGKNITTYRSRYFYPGRQLPSGVITEWIPRPGAQRAVFRKLEDIALSMDTEGRVELPGTTFNEVVVPLDPVNRARYKKLKKELVLDLDVLGKYTAPTAAALSTKLAQITAGFLYDDEHVATQLHTNKIRAVQEIIEGTGSPVIVFYRFTAEREALVEALPQASTIDDPNVIERWCAGEVPVLIAHPASIGHGLNLQSGGHTAVWTTLPWSLEEWQQSNKRLARSGQQHPVMIHILVSPGTVDLVVSKALRSKTSVQDALLEHLESPL